MIQRELNCAAMRPTDPELMEALPIPRDGDHPGPQVRPRPDAPLPLVHMQVVASDSEMGEKFRQTSARTLRAALNGAAVPSATDAIMLRYLADSSSQTTKPAWTVVVATGALAVSQAPAQPCRNVSISDLDKKSGAPKRAQGQEEPHEETTTVQQDNSISFPISFKPAACIDCREISAVDAIPCMRSLNCLSSRHSRGGL